MYSVEEIRKIIALKPKNEMGQAFMDAFGTYTYNVLHSEKDMMTIAIDAFFLRFNVSQKQGTNLSKMNLKVYDDRIQGLGDTISRSFGVKNHRRAHSIYEKLSTLSEDLSQEIISPIHTRRVIGGDREHTSERKREFPFDDTISFNIWKTTSDTYLVQHAHNSEIPGVLKKLTKLRKKCLETKEVKFIAEFEWLRYWSNPFGRAGATIGSILSLDLQKKLKDCGINIRFRDNFHHQDLEALSSNKENYIEIRSNELVKYD